MGIPDNAAFPPDASLLVVDDEWMITASIETLLGDRCRVRVARSGAQALELLDRTGYPVVILDIRLPDMSGLDLLIRIKRDSPATEVIMLTGFEDRRRSALEYGAAAYLTKPFSIDVLEQEVTAAMVRYDADAGARPG